MKITNQEIQGVLKGIQALEGIKSLKLDSETNWSLALAHITLERYERASERSRSQLIQRSGLVPGYNYETLEELRRVQELKDQIAELLQQSVEVEGLKPIEKDKLLKGGPISPSVISLLMPIIANTEEGEG